MKAVFAHIDRIKESPHHVRRQVALLYAGIGTGIIALIWLIGSLSFGAFAIGGSNFAESTIQEEPVIVSGTSALAGVAASANQNAPAHIQIVDTAPKQTGRQAEQTTLPF